MFELSVIQLLLLGLSLLGLSLLGLSLLGLSLLGLSLLGGCYPYTCLLNTRSVSSILARAGLGSDVTPP